MAELEDALGDIVAKARRGRGMSEGDLAAVAGLTLKQIEEIESYELVPEDAVVWRLAEALDLKTPALVDIAHGNYSPEEPDLNGYAPLRVISSPFSTYLVNAYLLWDPDSRNAVLFDTGTDMQPIRETIDSEGLHLEVLALTHTHRDHVAIIDEVRSLFGPRVIASPNEPVPQAQLVADNESFTVGALGVVVRETDGHSPGGLTFIVSGPGVQHRIAVVGDALFAGSAGGAAVSYDALHSGIREKILTLPDETLILPGHGPMTTVGQEKRHNPFAP